MPDLTVAAGVALALVEFAAARGGDREVLLGHARIHEADLRQPDDRIPFETYVVLMRAAREICSDPAFALHFGEAVGLSEMSIVGLLDHGIETMADAIAQINRYASLLIETGGHRGARLVVEHHRREVWLVDTRPDPNHFIELTESTFARIVCETRRLPGNEDLLRGVHVTHPAPAYRPEYERVFRVPVVFESDRNALVYDPAWWAQRFTPERPYVSEILAAHADRLLQDLEQSKSMRGRVERLLIPRLEDGDTTMAAIASELGLTRATLGRRLKSEGVTFARVLDELRRTLALACLRDGRLSVSETAYRVGFSDPAPFSRAFKRWTGRSPRDFVAGTGEESDGAPDEAPPPKRQ